VQARAAITPLDNGLGVVAPPWRFGSSPPAGPQPRRAIGLVGGDGTAVLRDYGFDDGEIAGLIEAGALIPPQADPLLLPR
jgi:hypothetical protein